MTDAVHLTGMAMSQVPGLSRPRADASAREIAESAAEFEAVFIGQMVKPMFETLDAQPPFGGGFAEETWRGVLADEIGRAVSAAGGIGLADAVAGELLRAQEATAAVAEQGLEGGRR